MIKWGKPKTKEEQQREKCLSCVFNEYFRCKKIFCTLPRCAAGELMGGSNGKKESKGI